MPLTCAIVDKYFGGIKAVGGGGGGLQISQNIPLQKDATVHWQCAVFLRYNVVTVHLEQANDGKRPHAQREQHLENDLCPSHLGVQLVPFSLTLSLTVLISNLLKEKRFNEKSINNHKQNYLHDRL